MWKTLAQILGRHTTDILGWITNSGPDDIRFSIQPWEEDRPVCELAVSIDFEGFLAEGGRQVGGYLVCGAVRSAEIQLLLGAVAVYLGLEPAVQKTEAGPQNILNEFLNIIIGLTSADWSAHGFEMNFSPPQVLSGRALPPSASGDKAFHLSATSQAGVQVDIMVVFNDQYRPTI